MENKQNDQDEQSVQLSQREIDCIEQLAGFSLREIRNIARVSPNDYFRTIWDNWVRDEWGCGCQLYDKIDWEGEGYFYDNYTEVPVPYRYYVKYREELTRPCWCEREGNNCNHCHYECMNENVAPSDPHSSDEESK